MTSSNMTPLRTFVALASLVVMLSLAVAQADAYMISADSTGGPVSIVDDGDPTLVAGKSILLTLTGQTIVDVDVTVEVTHEFVGDLVFRLEGPDGTQIVLANRPGTTSDFGGAAANMSADVPITFDDSAATNAELMGNGLDTMEIVGAAAGSPSTYFPFSGTLIPGPTLSAFNGMSPTGEWTLTVGDGAAGATGTFVGWTLSLETERQIIPEPTAAAMLGLGWAGLLVRRTRKRA